MRVLPRLQIPRALPRQREEGEGGGITPENQHDVNSEPEMVNNSSGEDEPGGVGFK